MTTTTTSESGAGEAAAAATTTTTTTKTTTNGSGVVCSPAYNKGARADNQQEENGVMVEALPTFTLAEVELHNKPGDYWTAIGHYVYDISSWIASGAHPGGELIMQAVGRDATVLFETSHPEWVAQRQLPRYRIGILKRQEGSFPYQWESTFYRTLKRRVTEHFRATGLSPHGSPLLWLQTLHTIFFFFLFWYLAFVRGSLWACLPCGWFYSQFGIAIMHDGNHGAYSKNPLLCRFAGIVMDLIGASSLVWKHEHNIGHHQFTNSTADPDSTTAFPLIRYNPAQPWRPYHAYQHFYVWLLYPFICFKWYLSDIAFVWSGKYRGIPMYQPSRAELIFLACTKVAFPLFISIPTIYYHGLLQSLLITNVVFMTASYCFALQFVVTHLADDVIFPEEYKQETDWAKCQVIASSNYSWGNPLVTWLSGGLNYQIEHHLFPTVSHVHLASIAPIVRETCKEHGVPYFVHDGFLSALYHHYAHLKRMGQPPQVFAGAATTSNKEKSA